ncbi:MAG: DUF4900 domain-containing protein [bacterium]
MTSKRQGIAMALTLFAMSLLFVIGMALVSIMMTESQSATGQLMSTKAYYAARSGIARALIELPVDYNWGQNESSNPDDWTRGNVSDSYYNVKTWASPSNPGNIYKLWQATSVGRVGSFRRTLVAWVETESFAKFAYFTDSEKGASGDTIWFFSRDCIGGNAHTNGYFSISGNPRFGGRVDSHNDTDSYYKTTYYSQGGHNYTDPFYYYHYYSSYAADIPIRINEDSNFSFAGGMPSIALPTDTGNIKDRANYTYNGNVTIVLHATGAQGYMDVTCGGHTDNNVPISATGTTVYTTGQLIISGTLAGRMTIAAKGQITIPNDIIYADRSRDVLGMVSEGHIIVSRDPDIRRDIEIDAAIMTLNNSFKVNNYDSGVARGTLHIFGGIIQKHRGCVSTFSGNNLATGYAKDYQYDAKLVNMPPPNFPTTGKIKVKAWMDMGSLGQ